MLDVQMWSLWNVGHFSLLNLMTHHSYFYYVILGNLGNFSHQKLNKSPVQKRYKMVRCNVFSQTIVYLSNVMVQIYYVADNTNKYLVK